MSDGGKDARALPPVLRGSGDVRLRSVLALLGLVGALLLTMMAIAWLLFPNQRADRRFALPLPPFPAPVLQPSPRADWAAFHAAEMQRLNGAGWQDRARGRVHIPIGQAMRAVAAEGIAGWPQPGAAGTSMGASLGASLGDRR